MKEKIIQNKNSVVKTEIVVGGTHLKEMLDEILDREKELEDLIEELEKSGKNSEALNAYKEQLYEVSSKANAVRSRMKWGSKRA